MNHYVYLYINTHNIRNLYIIIYNGSMMLYKIVYNYIYNELNLIIYIFM